MKEGGWRTQANSWVLRKKEQPAQARAGRQETPVQHTDHHAADFGLHIETTSLQ